MKKEIEKKVEEFIRDKSRKRKSHIMLAGLSIIIALCTFNVLMSPAITLEDGQPYGIIDAIGSPGDNEDASAQQTGTGGDAAQINREQTDIDVPAPTQAAETPAPAETTETPASAETTETPASAETTETPAPAETTETPAPAGTTETPAPAGTTDPPAPAGTPSPTEAEKSAARTEYTYEEQGLRVIAVLSDPASVPDDAELRVTRITEENDPENYKCLQQLLKQKIGAGVDMPFFAYNIGFFIDGEEVEPVSDTVSVTIEDTSASETTAGVQVFHVMEEGSAVAELQEVPAEMSPEAGAQEVTFTAESFSTYVTIPSGSRLTYKQYPADIGYFTSTIYCNSSRPLGIAGNFGVVAFGKATLGNSHCNSNILAYELSANNNFGTNNLTDELTYVQNYSTVFTTSASSEDHVLALGSSNSVTFYDTNNSFKVNGIALGKPWNIWQDDNTSTNPFINLNAVKQEITGISSNLKSMSSAYIDTTHLSTSGGSCPESYIQLTDPGKVGIYNITASALSSYQYFGVAGFTSGANAVNGTVIINVNCADFSGTLSMPQSNMYVDVTPANGNEKKTNETTNFINGKILWNFYNCPTGMVIQNWKTIYGTMIALNATIDTHSNVNGSIIAENVIIEGENHRDDFVGKLSNGATVTVNKIWLGNDGTQIAAPDGVSVTLQLFRSSDGGVTKAEYGTLITLNSTTGWTYSWTELPEGYLYSVTETSVTKSGVDITRNYRVTYSSTVGVTGGTLSVSNQFVYTLPDTGGPGTMPFAIGGLLLMGTALWIYIRRKHRGKKARPSDTGPSG